MNEWRECRLGDVATVRGGKRLPKGKMLTELPTNHPYIRITDFNGHKILLDNIEYVTDEVQKAIARYTVDAGDLVVSIVGTIGLSAIIPKELDKANLTENCANIHVNGDDVDKLFLYYYLTSGETQASIAGFNVGSTQPKLPLYNIQNIGLILPPFPEQRAIAGVLSSLDDKIDLLHRQNKTLESMAEALWRKMFVEEADPGWKKGKLGDLIELRYGKGLREGERISGRYPVLGSSGIVGHHNDFLVKGPGIVIGRKGTLGIVNYIEDDFFPIDTTYYVKSKTNSGKLFFEYFLLKEFAFEEMNSDSAVPGLNRIIAESMEFIIPEMGVISRFNDLCEPLFAKRQKDVIQIRTLSHLRDTLLPKLMSGEVRVKYE